jgi:hypothetical protein
MPQPLTVNHPLLLPIHLDRDFPIMALTLLMLQIPLWNVEQSDLADPDWRDANQRSLPLWHPVFFEILPELTDFFFQYFLIMKKYKNLLSFYCFDEPTDHLETHVTEEAELWIFDFMAEITSAVWGE